MVTDFPQVVEDVEDDGQIYYNYLSGSISTISHHVQFIMELHLVVISCQINLICRLTSQNISYQIYLNRNATTNIYYYRFAKTN